MKKLILLSTTAALLPSAAFAQSTGSVDFEEEIVITGGIQDIDGISFPDTAKPKQVLGEEVFDRQSPGQTFLDATNIVPGVSFTSNDAYGGSGGEIVMRGFDDSRVSITFDGIPLNDSGNYAIYTGQTLDGELIEQVNVNLGTTDVDSPTASAVGGTVNVRMRNPDEDFGARFVQSFGEYNFYRTFMSVDSGNLTSGGLRALAAFSHEEYDNAYNGYGQVNRQQYNAKVYQPLGSNGDFVSVSGHYNTIRNNFFGSVGLRYDRAPGGGFPQTKGEREYSLNFPCMTEEPTAGVADETNSCGTEFERRYNPADTGNIRGALKLSLTDQLTLTVDPSYQYVKANGGGTRTGYEFACEFAAGRCQNFRTFTGTTTPIFGYVGGNPWAGIDLNGDGDLLDQVTLLTPSQTRTHRYGVISGLRYDINDSHTVRFSYTYDDANHRQTGQVGYVRGDGEPVDVFPVDDPIVDVNGNTLQKRDRQSYATLHQISAEWRGEFDALTVNVGARYPFFKRDLEQYCFTTSASGFVDCFGQGSTEDAQYATLNDRASEPQRRELTYDKFLPNVGLVYEVTNNASVFASYAKSISVPGTDQLYDSFFFAEGSEGATPVPETTDTFDAGVRYTSSIVQAQANVWYTKFNNRLAVSYIPELDEYLTRNLGPVDKYGLDLSVAIAPIPELTIYTFGSWYGSEIKDDVEIDDGVFAPTAGKREGGAPTQMFGTSIVGNFGLMEASLTTKYTGPRYLYDTNEPTAFGGFTEKTDGYWLTNAQVRFDLDEVIDGVENTFLQVNAYNLFDTLYVGSFGGRLSPDDGIPFVQIGVPRTFSATFGIGF